MPSAVSVFSGHNDDAVTVRKRSTPAFGEVMAGTATHALRMDGRRSNPARRARSPRSGKSQTVITKALRADRSLCFFDDASPTIY